ncbi:MAG: tetratricopeptide repeat protein [Alphaproteobacteria bacterium]|nr:tetratricopeptide repeat protein [Alphaproteobacteria bacterium]
MENLEQQASILFGKKEYEKALEIYTLLSKGEPKNEEYVVNCGNCFDALGDKTAALECYEKALKMNRNSESALLNISTINYETGNYDFSREMAEKVLKINPKNVAAMQNLGNIAYCNADYENALKYYQEMYENNKRSYIAMINIANTYYAMGKYVLALDFAKKSMERHPSSAVANAIAGNSLYELGKYQKAIDYMLKAAELDENNFEMLNSLSDTYRAINDWENCMLFAWRYIKRKDGTSSDASLNFGYLLYECYAENNQELAQKYAAKWLKRFPEDKIVLHMGNAIADGKALDNSSPEFIKAIFDAFATGFDTTLQSLDYQAPQLIDKALSKILKPTLFNKYHIMDLGCGTGLCGVYLKKYASYKGLIGVDLSEKMLAEAEKKNVYAKLICDDICHYLETSSYLFQVITASDVLTYFGDLTKVFVRTSKSLTPGGVFVFTVTENDFNDNDFFMAPSGRFVHSLAYVERVLKSAGLKIISQEQHILRNEAEKAVYGYVIVAQKPDLSKK